VEDFEKDPNFDADAPIGSDVSAPHPDLEGLEPETKEAAPAEAPWDWKQHYAREVEYNAAGKVVKEPFEMVLKRASQGYDYAQKVGEWNKKEQDFTGKLTQAEQRLKEFEYLKQVDDYARQNPQWKQHIDKMWEQRDIAERNLDPNDPIIQLMNQKLEKLMEPINNLTSKVTQFDQFVSQQRISKEDQELDAEVKSIREKHSDLDWDARDEFGKTLEARVLEHAAKMGLGSNPGAFRMAFRDFNHDHLVKTAQDRAKEAVADQAHRLKKAGFIGKSSTPQTGITQAKSLREKSYDDLFKEGLEELGIN
jgi:hypothetical protein